MRSLVKILRIAFLAIVVVLATGPLQAWAQTASFLSDDATECEMFRGLSKVVPGECATADDRPLSAEERMVLTRSIKRKDGSKSAKTAVQQQNPPEELEIALMVNFEFDSYELTADAKEILDRLAAVMNDDLMEGSYIRIEGHADASGSASYNKNLSERRAHAVRKYLIEQHQVESNNLLSIGKGEEELYDPNSPNAGVNRRVEFANLRG